MFKPATSPRTHPSRDGSSERGANFGTVAPFYNEEHLARALSPWSDLGKRQRWVRAQLLLTDLSVLVFCLIAGGLTLALSDGLSIAQGLRLFWGDSGSLRASLFALISASMVAWMWGVQGHYTATRRKPWWEEARDVVTVILVAAMADAMVMYLTKVPLSRLWTGTTWACVFVSLPLARLLTRVKLFKGGLLTQPYVLIGHPGDVEKAAAALASDPLLGYRPVAVVCPNPGERLVQLKSGDVIAPTPLTPAVLQFLAKPACYQLVGVLGTTDNQWLRETMQTLMLTRDDLVVVPALGQLPIHGMEVSHFFSHEVLMLHARNNLNRRGPQILKRALDIVGASIALLLLSPLFAWVAWKIKREDAGPAFFVQDRIGVDGKKFKFIKFRSMVMDADAALERWKTENEKLYVQYLASNFKLAHDPRITKIGRLIRRTSIDELPQLINVLLGEMSLVGPRPLLARELPEYGGAIAAYGKARPGLTGLWQISGRSASTFQHRIDMDLWYVRNWSLWYDIVIMLRTVRVVLRQDGAC